MIAFNNPDIIYKPHTSERKKHALIRNFDRRLSETKIQIPQESAEEQISGFYTTIK